MLYLIKNRFKEKTNRKLRFMINKVVNISQRRHKFTLIWNYNRNKAIRCRCSKSIKVIVHKKAILERNKKQMFNKENTKVNIFSISISISISSQLITIAIIIAITIAITIATTIAIAITITITIMITIAAMTKIIIVIAAVTTIASINSNS